ncbi:hypothetical protein HI914_05314 [Erysiphe necator]|nr:hypothetical protein HI914_05314 [Erysiphe necator]
MSVTGNVRDSEDQFLYENKFMISAEMFPKINRVGWLIIDIWWHDQNFYKLAPKAYFGRLSPFLAFI